MITSGTYKKQHFFNSDERLDFLQKSLLEFAADFGWRMQAWAIFPNHYHFLARSNSNSGKLSKFLGKLHMKTAQAVNRLDNVTGRKVWYQYWDTQITFTNSYWPRLRYIQENPVLHGLVPVATQYRWCSAAWFEQTATSAIQQKVKSYRIDKLKIHDDF